MTTRTITNRKGKTFTVLLDDQDAPYYDARNWYVSTKGYLVHSLRNKDHLWFHRMVMDAPDDMQVDHRDSNRLNNCKENLRLCTPAENARNRKRSILNTSGYVGVTWKDGKWESEITVDGRNIYLGSYDDPRVAGLVRDRAALEHHGDFAKLNIPELALAN